MRFGLESEKFIFNLKRKRPSRGVFRFIDALSDYETYFGVDVASRVTNEFVLNLIEIGTSPSDDPNDVIKDYLFHLLLLQSVAIREDVALVPLGSLPMDYLPHMLPKWPYYVQNSILDNKKQDTWNMESKSPLRAAGNCAGVHVHVEVETSPEFLFSNRELQDKFNMGLMMTPMIAFSSSPYFYGVHKAASMRGLRYFRGVYRHEPFNGGLPPVMNSSEEVLRFVQHSVGFWVERGVALGFSREEMHRLTLKKGANWNPLRWNRQWNTIEIRCIESDRMDLDAAKFLVICMAMQRMDIRGEALQCRPIKSAHALDRKMIDECFEITGNSVTVLNTELINELFDRAILKGTQDELVEAYLNKLFKFAQVKVEKENQWALRLLRKTLKDHSTTAEAILEMTRRNPKISAEKSLEVVNFALEEQNNIMREMKKHYPDVFMRLRQTNPDFYRPQG